MAIRHTRLNIEGMTCQSCATRIEKVLNKKDFIRQASVNFAGETVQIDYDDSHTDVHQLIGLIEQTGFQAALPDEHRQPENPAAMPWRLRLLLLIALPFAVGMIGMLAGTHALMPPLWLQILLAAVVQCWLAVPFYRSAWASLRGGVANMDVLVSIGTLAIFGYSLGTVWAGHGTHHVYFEAGVMVIAFVSLGKFLEERTKRGSLNSLGLLLQLTPQQVAVQRDGLWQDIALDKVRIGDTLRGVHGGRIAADGTVLSGEAWADESHLTGESQPVFKTAGDRVLAGALLSGSLMYRADKLGRDTLLGDMMAALAEAQGSKAPIARLADQTAAVFVPAVVGVAGLTLILTWLFSGSLSQAVVHAVAVLVVACPCALGLATPAAVMAGMGVAVRHGVWFKNAAALEAAGRIDTVVLDKTGTLTEGKPVVSALWVAADGNETLLFQAAAAVEQHAAHPLAQAVLQAAQARSIQPPATTQPHTEAGAGLTAHVDGLGQVCVGKPDYCGFRLPEDVAGQTQWQAASVVAVSLDGRPLGAFALTDALKSDSRDTVQRLQQHGIRVYILSGDRPEAVQYAAAQLGLEAAHALGGQSPRDKAAFLQRLKSERRHTAMVGDGINDAPALALADVGFAVKGGTDAAEHSAAAVLVRPSVSSLADGLLIARATLTNIRQNLFFAFIYNILGIPLAAFGLLTPVAAGAMMAASSVSVLANALRLKRWRV